MSDRKFKAILYISCSCIIAWGIFTGFKYFADLNRFESKVQGSGRYSKTVVIDKMTGERRYK